MADGDAEVRMEVKGLMLDPSSNSPIVILRSTERELFLPIWIGVFEANAIAMRLEGVEPPRPMTHDLLKSTLERLECAVEKVVVSDLRENTFYASLHLRSEAEGTFVVDARPSDALAIALRADAPVFALESVLKDAEAVELVKPTSSEEDLRRWLESIDPEELGKYEM